MPSLRNLSISQLQSWVDRVYHLRHQGNKVTYISHLATVSIDSLAVEIRTTTHQILSLGDTNLLFPLMSVIKPFLLWYLLDSLGPTKVFQKVGKQYSDMPYNSLEQLLADGGMPRNPMLNSGAISLCHLLPGESPLQRCYQLQQWLNNTCGTNLVLDTSILATIEQSPSSANVALTKTLMEYGHIDSLALNTYNHICCLSGNIKDISCLGLTLLSSTSTSSLVLKVMRDCGLYEASSQFAQNIGFPSKSGVSGVLLSVIPSQGVMACYSPSLNSQGNSIVGLALAAYLRQYLTKRTADSYQNDT